MIRTTILTVSFTEAFVREKFSASDEEPETRTNQQEEIVRAFHSLLPMHDGTVEINSLSLFPISASLAVRHDEPSTEILEAKYRELLKSLPVRSVAASSQDTFHEVPSKHAYIVDANARRHLTASLSTHTTLWLEPSASTPTCPYTAWVLDVEWSTNLTIDRLERARYAPDFSGGRFPKQSAALWRRSLREHASAESACRTALRTMRGSLDTEELRWAVESSMGVATPNHLFAKAVDKFEHYSLGLVAREIRVWVGPSCVLPHEVLTSEGESVFNPSAQPNLKADLPKGYTLVVAHTPVNYGAHRYVWLYLLWDEYGDECACARLPHSPSPDLHLIRIRSDLFQGKRP